MRILIVDDSPDDRLLLQTILGKAALGELLFAGSADEAFRLLGLEAAAEPSPGVDLILMDVMMPGIDGIAACRRLKSEPRAKDVPVIMVTGKTGPKDLNAAFAAGAMDYITKPLNKVELVARVNSAIAIQRAQAELRHSEKRMRDIAAALGEGVYVLDAEGRLTFMNPEAEALLGWSERELLGRQVHELIHYQSEDGKPLPVANCPISAATRQGKVLRSEDEVFIRKDGSRFPVSFVAAPLLAEGAYDGLVMAFQDITARREAEAGLHLAAKVIENSLEGILVTDPRGRVVSVNPAFTTFTGYTPEEIVGKNPNVLKSGRQDETFYREMWRALNASGQWQGEIWNRHKNGEIYPEWLSISAIKDHRGRTTQYVGIFADISALKLAEQRLEHLATHDMLTGLPNRMLLLDRLEQAVAGARRQQSDIALLFIDLDRFKPINDTLGHEAGDVVLQEIAWRLKRCVRETDTVARIGGDEFVVVLQDVTGEKDVSPVAEKIIRAMSEPVTVLGQQRTVGASIGISLYSKSDGDVDDLITTADQAMYHVKETGRNHYAFYHHMSQSQRAVAVGVRD